MKQVHNCPELMEAIGEMGFLPLLGGDIEGFSADELVAPECRYVALPDGGWGCFCLEDAFIDFGRVSDFASKKEILSANGERTVKILVHNGDVGASKFLL